MTLVRKLTLDSISSAGNSLPNRYVLHAVEGWGKTSWSAQTPKPIFIQSKGETGLETLIDNNQLPSTPHFPESQTWDELISAVDVLITGDHEYKTLALDTINGAERLCHEYICATQFDNKWGNDGFAAYGKGPDVALVEWRLLLSKLDELRLKRKMAIVMLCHTKVKAFRNPEGSDFDRYQPDLNEKTWSLTHKWADAVFFGNFYTVVQGGSTGADDPKKARKGKASGGQQRIMFTQRSAAFDAKNRLGLAGEIEMGDNAADGWNQFKAALIAGKAVANG